MKNIRVPKKACATCPYARTTPSGVWARDEYEKLRTYDEGGGELTEWPDGSKHVVPALATFHCHQEAVTKVDTVCRGWLSVHRDSVAVRLACVDGRIDPNDVPREVESEYYATGAAAADAGEADISSPSPTARKAVDRLASKGVFSEG